MAERYWPEGRALGGTVIMSRARVRVVGIVENVTWFGLSDEVTNDMYLPLAQSPRVAGSSLTLGVRTVGDTDASLVTVREIVRAIEPELSLRYQRSMETMVADVFMPQRLGAALLTVFGLLALVLSAVGIAYAISRQARDIGVRVALGATKVSVLTGISRGMVLPVLLGLGVGVLTARSLSRLVEGFMFGVTATDPLTYGLISLSVLAVAVAATLLPARCATRVNPVEVVRAD